MTHRYVRHISGQGEKWKVAEPQTTTAAWCVYTPPGSILFFHYLPTSEYQLCDPPEWENVTSRCYVNETRDTVECERPSYFTRLHVCHFNSLLFRLCRVEVLDGTFFIIQQKTS